MVGGVGWVGIVLEAETSVPITTLLDLVPVGSCPAGSYGKSGRGLS